MINLFSMGCDGGVSRGFHAKQKEHPYREIKKALVSTLFLSNLLPIDTQI